VATDSNQLFAALAAAEGINHEVLRVADGEGWLLAAHSHS
jgi:hypothetical protein